MAEHLISRRALFQSVINHSADALSVSESIPTAQNEVALERLDSFGETRRQIIYAGCILIPAFLAHKTFVEPIQNIASKLNSIPNSSLPNNNVIATINKRLNEHRNASLPSSDLQVEDAYSISSYLETLSLQSILAVGEFVSSMLLNKLGIKTGNGTTANNVDALIYLLQHPKKLYKEVVVVASAKEESLYRLWPSFLTDLLKPNSGTHWDIGFITSLIFAFRHNVFENSVGKISFAKQIPLPQFIDGLYFWWLTRTKNISHAVLSHSAKNAFYATFLALYYRLNPEKVAASIGESAL